MDPTKYVNKSELTLAKHTLKCSKGIRVCTMQRNEKLVHFKADTIYAMKFGPHTWQKLGSNSMKCLYV